MFREACPHDFSLERVKALAAASLEYIRSSRGPTTRLASMLTAAEALILLDAARHDRYRKVAGEVTENVEDTPCVLPEAQLLS